MRSYAVTLQNTFLFPLRCISSSMEWEKESWALYMHVQLYMYTADLEGKLKDAEHGVLEYHPVLLDAE